ncbi:MAG TPA: creatininase family protein [Pirellulales bacterium]|jgi:creatinine amidohydrolase/Fe(II)-dependent formamide hydrolase-like protein|nr:creatininase family protein [Pirellulales bacterium]
MNRALALALLLFATDWRSPRLLAADPPLDAPRPIEAIDTVFSEEMTWMEVRDAIAAGKTTAIVATGGVEQNGPYLATGKHNYILRATTQAIARRLGNALVAPIVPFVPEGDIDPPTQHMRYPGTISVSESTFDALLIDICASLRTHGFKNIVLLGDSGGNQAGMKRVSERLNDRWGKNGTRVHFVAEYYDYNEVAEWLEKEGLHQEPEGWHDDLAVTAILMTVDPNLVRMKERGAAGKFSINGVELAPAAKTIELGKRIIDFRASATVRAIERAIGP